MNSNGILCDWEIQREIKDGNIILYDPDRSDLTSQIQNCSVDVTLGPHFYRNRTHSSSGPYLPYLNPWSKRLVDNYWSKQCYAETATDFEVSSYGLTEGDKYIELGPMESILGHTQEFVGGRNYITTMLKARSSLGRNNITICRDAGWGDIGYCSRWTLEITNNSNCNTILPVGKRVGQIIFFYTNKPSNPYSGKYQTIENFQQLTVNWTPSDMLPKAYLDN